MTPRLSTAHGPMIEGAFIYFCLVSKEPGAGSVIHYHPNELLIFPIAAKINSLVGRERRIVAPGTFVHIPPSGQHQMVATEDGSLSYLYDIGEQVSKKDFSKGSFDGVLCSEVANNATIGGGLLPTLTLGIPGNNSSAIFLAALNLHGIIVGPSINMDHPGFMYFLYASLLMANFLMSGRSDTAGVRIVVVLLQRPKVA